MKTKKEIAIKLTDKNRKKVQGILEMFGYRVDAYDLNCYYIHFSGNNIRGCAVNMTKTLVKPRELRNILASEKINKEIDLLEGKKSLEVGKWYKYEFNLNGDRRKNGYLLFNFNGLFKEYSQYGFKHNISGGFFCNDISIYEKNIEEYKEATPQEVELSLIKEAKRIGFKDGVKIKTLFTGGKSEYELSGDTYSYYADKNQLFAGGVLVFDKGQWATIIEVDKFEELKEAHKNGAVIECLQIDDTWFEIENPNWSSGANYRIKPDDSPKVGDVVMAWDGDGEGKEIVGCLNFIDKDSQYYCVGTHWYDKAKKLTQQEVIDLLFKD